jgi:hypothetical protein
MINFLKKIDNTTVLVHSLHILAAVFSSRNAPVFNQGHASSNANKI